jgi:hypothetical protein
MTQDYTINSYQADHVGQTNLANMEKNLECLRSFFSGASAPSNLIEGHVWWDTSSGTELNPLPKIRGDNSDWLAILTGDVDQKIWIYRNDIVDGWAIDTSVTDRVIALKGGSDLYDRTGGGVAGETWANLKAHVHTGPSHSHSHNHKWYNYTDADHVDESFDSGGSDKNIQSGSTKNSSYGHIARSTSDSDGPLEDFWTNDDATAGGTANTGAQSTADVRPAAAVGTLQYPDI